jgi:hypothetical protein
MKEEDLVDLLRKIFKTNASIDFLSKIEPEGFETLIACKGVGLSRGKEGLIHQKLIWQLGKPLVRPVRLEKV